MAKTVRYVNTSSGVNVRDAAAGNKVRSLLQGTLMIYDTANAPCQKGFERNHLHLDQGHLLL